MSALAASPSAGNVMSRDFQFTAVDYMRPQLLGDPRHPETTMVSWSESAIDRAPELITDSWIYAFEFEEKGKPILAAEYQADARGALSVVAGNVRRRTAPEQVQAERVNAACLPILKQGRRLMHFFVVTRRPLPKRAIFSIENKDGASKFFVRRDLAADGIFIRSGRQPTWFVRVADPLTVAEALSRRYHQALNEAIRFNVPIKGDPEAPKVESRARKYQLGSLIRDVLRFHEDDPFGVRQHLGGYGEPLLQWMRDHDKHLRGRVPLDVEFGDDAFARGAHVV